MWAKASPMMACIAVLRVVYGLQHCEAENALGPVYRNCSFSEAYRPAARPPAKLLAKAHLKMTVNKFPCLLYCCRFCGQQQKLGF